MFEHHRFSEDRKTSEGHTKLQFGEERKMSDKNMKSKWKWSETRKRTSLGVAKTNSNFVFEKCYLSQDRPHARFKTDISKNIKT